MYIELWKWIPGWEGYYMVSTHGRVKSVDKWINCNGGKRFIKGRIRKQLIDKDGYKTVMLYKGSKSKSFRVHRLVALAFIPNPNNYPIVNHKDENPGNNFFKNLEWCTVAYNTAYSSYRISKAKEGKPCSEETKRKLSEVRKGKYTGKDNPTSKPILMFTKDGQFIKRFDCISDAIRYLGKNGGAGNITKCAKGIYKTCYGYIWRYEKD